VRSRVNFSRTNGSRGMAPSKRTLERQTNPSARFRERRCYIDKPSGSFASNLKFPLSREPDSNSRPRHQVILWSCLVDFGDWSPLEFDEISDERKLKPMGQAERPTCPHCGAFMILAPSPDGKGQPAFQCLECDGLDPLKPMRYISVHTRSSSNLS
jgi:hypothetical protein